MPRITKPPKFKSDDEAGRWYSEHPEYLEQRYEQAATAGTLRRGRMTPEARLAEAKARRAADSLQANSVNISIRVTQTDIDRARLLAERRGLKYQTYIKMLLHQALDQEEAAASK